MWDERSTRVDDWRHQRKVCTRDFRGPHICCQIRTESRNLSVDVGSLAHLRPPVKLADHEPLLGVDLQVEPPHQAVEVEQVVRGRVPRPLHLPSHAEEQREAGVHLRRHRLQSRNKPIKIQEALLARLPELFKKLGRRITQPGKNHIERYERIGHLRLDLGKTLDAVNINIASSCLVLVRLILHSGLSQTVHSGLCHGWTFQLLFAKCLSA